MQNDQDVQVHNERLGNGPDSNGINSTGSLRGPPQTSPGPSLPPLPPGPSLGSGKSTEQPFAMVLLPPIKNSRHSRPLAPPTAEKGQRQALPPGGARRVVTPAPVSSTPPVAPPRPEHTLTPNSRPIVTRPPPNPSTLQNVNNFENNSALLSTLTTTQQREPPVHLGLIPGPSSTSVTAVPPGVASSAGTLPNAIPVMELVSLPTLVNNNNNNSVINNNRKVSLTSPRPEPERETNLYTEAPKKLLLPQKSHISVISQNSANQQSVQQRHALIQSSGDNNPPLLAALNSSKVSAATLQKQKGGGLLDTQDISSQNFTNSSSPTDSSSIVTDQILEQSSIFCQDCGKCKCEACCRPRKLPQKWLCGGTILCSKTTVVDTLSCMFCVKGCFYHCTKDDLEETEIDSAFSNPCSCQGKHSTARWTAMATLWPILPCLLMYPILKGCAKMTEVVYAKCTASGCQCQNNYQHSNQHNQLTNKSTADSSTASSSLVSTMSADMMLTSSQLTSADKKELAANVNNPSFNSNKIIDAPPEKRLLITSSSMSSSSKNEPGVPGSNPSKLLLSNSSKPKLATTSTLQSSTPNPNSNTTATQIMRIKGGHFC